MSSFRPYFQTSHFSTTYAADLTVWCPGPSVILVLLKGYLFGFKCNKIHLCRGGSHGGRRRAPPPASIRNLGRVGKSGHPRRTGVFENRGCQQSQTTFSARREASLLASRAGDFRSRGKAEHKMCRGFGLWVWFLRQGLLAGSGGGGGEDAAPPRSPSMWQGIPGAPGRVIPKAKPPGALFSLPLSLVKSKQAPDARHPAPAGAGARSSALRKPKIRKAGGAQSIKSGFACGGFVALLGIYAGREACSRRCAGLCYSPRFLIDTQIISPHFPIDTWIIPFFSLSMF